MKCTVGKPEFSLTVLSERHHRSRQHASPPNLFRTVDIHLTALYTICREIILLLLILFILVGKVIAQIIKC